MSFKDHLPPCAKLRFQLLQRQQQAEDTVVFSPRVGCFLCVSENADDHLTVKVSFFKTIFTSPKIWAAKIGIWENQAFGSMSLPYFQ